ncbi:hypothetical protein [Stenotrophomonas sp.]|uniref:hypothetical protein n=1 Tax=Stenotrophomonas sp. TaxID=69392 RepID=UPI0028B1F515|nr:hypothetical protein [Stenotrophomonas sp.]
MLDLVSGAAHSSMIQSKLAHRRLLADGSQVLVWLTCFKKKYVFTACGVGSPGDFGSALRQDTKSTRRALEARFTGSTFDEVFVGDESAAVISVYRALTAAGSRDGVFFLCNHLAIQAAVLSALGARVPS